MKTNLRILAIAATLSCILSACASKPKDLLSQLDYEKLNAQALEEYMQPVHPGVPGEVPFWNKYSTKYIYAPVFGFDALDGAVNYCLSISAGEDTVFVCNSDPAINLSSIWLCISSHMA